MYQQYSDSEQDVLHNTLTRDLLMHVYAMPSVHVNQQ